MKHEEIPDLSFTPDADFPVIKYLKFEVINEYGKIIGKNYKEILAMAQENQWKMADVFMRIKLDEKFDKVLEHRNKAASLYKKILSDMEIEPPYEPDYAVHTYLKFPLLIRDRMKFFKLAEKEKIELGDWFLSPIHPIVKDFELWRYKWGENPVAEKISQHIVNLPTHSQVTEDYVDQISRFLKKNRNEIYDSYEEI